MKAQSGPPMQCPHGVDAQFTHSCTKCIRAERRVMAIPTVAMMAATLAQGFEDRQPAAYGADRYAESAWILYEAVCKKAAE